MRLADACCGFVRLAFSGQRPDVTKLFEKAKAEGYLKEA